MALFVGRIPRSMSSRELEDIFAKYGKVTRFDIKTDFGFVEFEDKEIAEQAMDGVNGESEGLVVEWAKNGGKRPGANECFNCGQEGHWSKDCRESKRNGRRGNGRGRGRSPRRDYRDRRDRDYYDRRDDRDRRSDDRERRSDDRSRRDDRDRYEGRDRRDRRERSPEKEYSRSERRRDERD
ncbi:hypothetical protein VTP01DRAFT_5904 [Rhizomucor pusillus]|uniref:uncharacterized protein n=1 Tax=Rhizomucor pusillus TaxID=4840 RepID=UPI003741EADD